MNWRDGVAVRASGDEREDLCEFVPAYAIGVGVDNGVPGLFLADWQEHLVEFVHAHAFGAGGGDLRDRTLTHVLNDD